MIHLRYCTIETDDWLTTVRFDDGASCEAAPHETLHYRDITARCGYGDDIKAYAREHEFAHAFVEERLHDRPSRILYGLAHGAMMSGPDAAYEEIAAQAFQRWLRGNERPIIGGVNWDRLKAEAMELLNPRTGPPTLVCGPEAVKTIHYQGVSRRAPSGRSITSTEQASTAPSRDGDGRATCGGSEDRGGSAGTW